MTGGNIHSDLNEALPRASIALTAVRRLRRLGPPGLESSSTSCRTRPCPCPALPATPSVVRHRTCCRRELVRCARAAKSRHPPRLSLARSPASVPNRMWPPGQRISAANWTPRMIPSSFLQSRAYLRIGEPPPETRGAAARLSPSSP